LSRWRQVSIEKLKRKSLDNSANRISKGEAVGSKRADASSPNPFVLNCIEHAAKRGAELPGRPKPEEAAAREGTLLTVACGEETTLFSIRASFLRCASY